MPADTPWRKKLIEVAIPLDAINRESAKDASIAHGHPSTMHRWWARRPLAACRAVIFCSLIDDPGEEGVPPELLRQIDALEEPRPLPAGWDDLGMADKRRQRLFAFVAKLVQWQSSTNETLLKTARQLIAAATDQDPPPVLDPFCGGGSIPLEAQRLGLEAHGSDLNPVAALVTKALIELPSKFAGMPPVNPDARAELGSDAEWKGAAGLAEDVRWYGEWMRQRAWERIGHLYPSGPNGETVIVWLWARTVRCPNPACKIRTPLVSTYWLSQKEGREAYLSPVIIDASVRFEIKYGRPPAEQRVGQGAKVGRAKFRCIACSATIDDAHVKDEGMNRRVGKQLLAVSTESADGRKWYASDHSGIVSPVEPSRPDTSDMHVKISRNTQYMPSTLYGPDVFTDFFTDRQLAALMAFSDLVGEARTLIRDHLSSAEHYGDTLADQYVSVLVTYLAFIVDRCADYWSMNAIWESLGDKVAQTFRSQFLPMVWDFAEANPFSNSTANWRRAADWIARGLERLPNDAIAGSARQQNATELPLSGRPTAIFTDPPYYDNIPYADISDYFYIWLRRALAADYPREFSTLATPKQQELVAAPHRLETGSKGAEQHFEQGLEAAFVAIRSLIRTDIPTAFFYAYLQRKDRPGWETMLSALIKSGFQITGTWPMRTEKPGSLKKKKNALASSIVLVCRPRPADAPLADLQEFNRALESELPKALLRFIGEHIAPVDLPQASIGPGMAVFSSYPAVVRPNGDRMSVQEALEEINKIVEQFFSEREGAFDAATQFCLRWFEQFGFEDGRFGDAHTVALAKGISVEELESDKLLTAQGGQVQLIPFERYEETWESWDPTLEHRLSAWRTCHYLAAALKHGGVFGQKGAHDAGGAARLAHKLGSNAEQAKELAYRLYAICDAKGSPQEAHRYNALADAWSGISAEAARLRQAQQGRLD